MNDQPEPTHQVLAVRVRDGGVVDVPVQECERKGAVDGGGQQSLKPGTQWVRRKPLPDRDTEPYQDKGDAQVRSQVFRSEG